MRAHRTTGVALRMGLALVVIPVFGIGCRTTRLESAVDPQESAEAIEVLGRPLAGDMAALYELAVPASGGLRLSLLQLGDTGRIAVNEPFGSALSMVEWSPSGLSALFDYRKGCRAEGSDMLSILGVEALPLPNAVRLLGGRLPVVDGDRVTVRADGRLEARGSGWSAVITVASDPWRVTFVEEVTGRRSMGWRVRLKNHSGSVPGWIRVDGADRRWAELELLRLQWDTVDELPALPTMPSCTEDGGGG